MTPNMIRSGVLAALASAALAGCGGDSAGYRHAADTADKAADRQAQQNTEMAKNNQTVAEGTKRLIEADAEARKEIVAVHKDLQAERATLNEGFSDLETERQQIAQDRRTESILLPAAKALGRRFSRQQAQETPSVSCVRCCRRVARQRRSARRPLPLHWRKGVPQPESNRSRRQAFIRLGAG